MKDSREHILFTSLSLFLQKSYKEVTMKEIVDKTGLSKGAFYHYFNSKERVFEEVINHFFAGMMDLKYNELPQDSLKSFYTTLLKLYEKNRIAAQSFSMEEERATNNFYYLLFDAMRMLPDFKTTHHKHQKEELTVWKNVIATARKNNEIKTEMSDEQVSKLFIYLSDGTNMNLILHDEINRKKNELKTLWDGLYNSLIR